MLYISRYIGSNKYGVVDTDDWKEEAVTRRDLLELLRLGVKVEGAVLGYKVDKHGVPSYRVDSVQIYQNAAFASGKQVKLQMLAGVDIKISGTEIVSIKWSLDKVRTGMRIRLSDFGCSLADHVFDDHNPSGSGGPVFVFDDKIKIRRNSFIYALAKCCAFDLSEVTNPRVIKWFYEEWLDRGFLCDIGTDIIDRQERAEYWHAVGVVTGRTQIRNERYSAEMLKAVEAKFYPEFEKLVNSRIAYIGGADARDAARSYIKELVKNWEFWRRAPREESIGLVMATGSFNVFNVLRRTTTMNQVYLTHFFLYMSSFTPSDSVKRLYVDLLFKANRWFLDLKKEMNWHVV